MREPIMKMKCIVDLVFPFNEKNKQIFSYFTVTNEHTASYMPKK